MQKIYLVAYKYWIEDYYECEEILDVGFRTKDEAVNHIKINIMEDLEYRNIKGHEDENYYIVAYKRQNGTIRRPEELNYDDTTFLNWYWQDEGSTFYFVREIDLQ